MSFNPDKTEIMLFSNTEGPKVESCWSPAETSQTVDDVALLIIFLLSLIQIIFKPFD
jgi:hypothetical protein